MNKYKFSQVLEVAVYILIGVFLVMAVMCSEFSDDTVSKPMYGIPTVYQKENEINTKSIDQIVDDGQRVYLLLNDQDGIVQVYDTDGNYLHSMKFFHSQVNGVFRIAVYDDILYVSDQQENLYLFDDGDFVEFIPYTDGTKIRKSISFENNSDNYVLRNSKIWRVDGSNDVCIIDRPAASFLYQDSLMFILGIGVIMVFAVLRAIKKK